MPTSKRFTMRALLFPAIALMALSGCASGSGGEEPRPSPHPGLLVGTWTVDPIEDAPEQPFVTFAPDNSWVASDGCNRVRGTWELSGNGELATTSGPHTRMGCAGAQIPMALSLASRVEAEDDDTIVLFSADQSTQTRLMRTDDRSIGEHGLPIGYWVAARTPDAPFLNFSADGTYSGSDGCNTLLGDWEYEADVVTFSAGATTLKYCEGVDDWLSGAVKGIIRSGVMGLQNADGLVIGQLEAM